MFIIIININGDLDILYGLELLVPSSGTVTRNCDIWRKLATRKTTKFCSAENMPDFCQNKYNHIKTNVLEKHIYWASQYDDLLIVSIQIYKIMQHRSNIPQNKVAVFPILLHFFEIKYYVRRLAAATADRVR